MSKSDGWTIEVVVLFLASRHWSRAHQTVVGRDGVNMTSDPAAFESRVASLYLKLSPDRKLRLEVWAHDGGEAPELPGEKRAGHRSPDGEPVALALISSRSELKPDVWYSIVAQSDGRWMRLFVNGQLEGMARAYGHLATPPRPQDGGLTFGCGMFDGVTTDTCSCLINEARVSEEARPEGSWLWVPSNASDGDASTIESLAIP